MCVITATYLASGGFVHSVATGAERCERRHWAAALLLGADTDTHICASSSDPFVVRSATMAEKRRGPPSRGGPYIWLPRLTDGALCDAGTQTDRRVEDMTTAVDILIKYQRTYNKKWPQPRTHVSHLSPATC